MGLTSQEYWKGLPFPLPGNLLHSGIKPASPALAGGFFTTQPPGKPISWAKSFNTKPVSESVEYLK